MLKVEGAVAQPLTLTITNLQDNFQAYSVDTAYANDDRVAEAAFTGVRLWDLLQKAEVALNDDQPDLMRVMARSADSFRCIVKWHEFDPNGDNNLIMVAYAKNGQPITDKHGPLRLVVPGDAQGLRYIGNLATLTVLNSCTGDE